MKIAIILPDGAADEPLAELGGQTPLEAARIPHTNWIVQNGMLGRAVTVPKGFTPATDVATMSLFGYDPARHYTGRAPIEAAAQGLRIGADELVFRCNFVTIGDGCMKSFTADHIRQDEADALIAALNELVAADDAAVRGCRFYAGVSYRNLMIANGASEFALTTKAPHDIPDQPIAGYLPHGRGEARAVGIMDRARALLRDHPVNAARLSAGRLPISDIWLWGEGRPTQLEHFEERWGLRGALITGVDIIRGLGALMGMHRIDVPGATGYLDTNYAGKGAAAVAALDDYDVVTVHIEAPDEAGHLGDAAEKVKAIERVDEMVVGPVLAALRQYDAWRILVAPDHPTPCTTKAHDGTPPPFCMAGTRVVHNGGMAFHEHEAKRVGWMVDPGYALMGLFLGQAPDTGY